MKFLVSMLKRTHKCKTIAIKRMGNHKQKRARRPRYILRVSLTTIRLKIRWLRRLMATRLMILEVLRMVKVKLLSWQILPMLRIRFLILKSRYLLGNYCRVSFKVHRQSKSKVKRLKEVVKTRFRLMRTATW